MNFFNIVSLFHTMDQDKRISNLEKQIKKQGEEQKLKEMSRTVVYNDYTNALISKQEQYPYEMDDISKKVWDFICTFQDEDFTVSNIAEALSLSCTQVNNIVSTFQKKGLTAREEILSNCGGTIKYIRLVKTVI